ncbi:MAG: aldehyde dehydrogenase family protein [Bacteroidales bacterium]|nr:aldehyde dehydrogenase family protein [Bacteroidales bacterium]
MTLENTPKERIDAIVAAQKAYFKEGETLDVKFRKRQLGNFLKALDKWEKELADALWTDLHKSYEEAYMTEIGLVRSEIKTHLKMVAKWAARKRERSTISIFPSRSYVVKEPLGTALIVSPWNYPVQLLLNPLVGAISAGCTSVLKPSPYVPHVSTVIEMMVKDTFEEKYVAVVQGNREVNAKLFDCRWDLIFFTGSPALARTVMASAAKNLTPCVLELGGKSPCIIDRTADIKTAAKRLAWGKTLNSGQTCIAPDYILIHESVRDAFIKEFGKQVKSLHGKDIFDSKHYVHMVSGNAFDRVVSYMENGTVVYGGRSDRSKLIIEPTLLIDVEEDSPVMNEEIFGPVFPMICLGDDGCKSFVDKVVDFVTSREKPLSFYYFGNEADAWEAIRRTSSGGGCINDVIMHIANDHIPFGGVGNSGMGHYHNKLSFDAFTHTRSVVSSPRSLDLPFRYMPYRLFGLVKKLL